MVILDVKMLIYTDVARLRHKLDHEGCWKHCCFYKIEYTAALLYCLCLPRGLHLEINLRCSLALGWYPALKKPLLVVYD